MATQIEELKRLQDLDLTIRAIRAQIDERPRRLGEQKGSVKQAGEQVQAKKQEILETQKALDSFDVDLKDGEEKLKRLKILLNAAKTNDEYALLNRSIKDQERKNSQLEEEILQLMGKTDELRDDLKSLKEQRGKTEETLEAIEAEAERETKALQGTLEERLSERNALASTIADEIVKQYERILTQRRDGALAQVADKVCQGCFMNVPNQWINLLQINRDIVTCPSCGRILHL